MTEREIADQLSHLNGCKMDTIKALLLIDKKNDRLAKEIDDLKQRLNKAEVEPVRNTTIQDVDVRVGIGGLTLDCEFGCIWFSTGGMRKLVDFLTKAIKQTEKAKCTWN